MKSLVICALVGFLLAGCGGDSPREEATADKPSPKASNPLAKQQQAIRDAEAVQGILNTDAARKKDALQKSD